MFLQPRKVSKNIHRLRKKKLLQNGQLSTLHLCKEENDSEIIALKLRVRMFSDTKFDKLIVKFHHFKTHKTQDVSISILTLKLTHF